MVATLDDIPGHPTWLRHTFYKKYSEILFANNSAKNYPIADVLTAL